MKNGVGWLVTGALLCLSVVPAAAQTAQGRAFGTTLDLLGSTLVDASDTQTRTAPNVANSPNPNGFAGVAAGAQVPVRPIAEVITGPSITRGCAVPGGCPELFNSPTAGFTPLNGNLSNETFVHSVAGDATASVLIGANGAPNLLDAVSNGANVTVRCNNDAIGSTPTPQVSHVSEVDALVINGSPITIPGAASTMTTSILGTGLPLVVINEFDCSTTTTSAS